MKVIGTNSKSVPTKKKRGVQGKIARKRHQANKLAQSLKTSGTSIIETTNVEKVQKASLEKLLKKHSPDSKNVFSGLNINIADLSKTLTTKSGPAFKTTIPKHFPKKDKRKLRHEAFVKKIEAVSELRREKKKKQRQLKTCGDVEMELTTPPLVLDSISKANESVEASKKKKPAERVSKKSIPKTIDRAKQDLEDIELFKQVMTNSVYQANPGEAITNYVRQKVCESFQYE